MLAEFQIWILKFFTLTRNSRWNLWKIAKLLLVIGVHEFIRCDVMWIYKMYVIFYQNKKKEKVRMKVHPKPNHLKLINSLLKKENIEQMR